MSAAFQRTHILPCALVAATLALAGCDGGAEREAEGGLATLVPPDSPVFIEMVIRADGERSVAINGLGQRIAGINDPADAIVSVVDHELGADASVAEDIEPWLGDNAAIFVRALSPGGSAELGDGALIVETTDPDAAQSFIDKTLPIVVDSKPERRAYKDFSYARFGDYAVGLVGDDLVWGTESSLKASVDAAEGDSLAAAEDFSELGGELNDEHLAEMWLDLGTALDAAAASAGTDGPAIDAARAAFGPLLEQPVMVELSATENTVVLETSAAGGPVVEGQTERLAALPASAWIGVAIEDLGEAASQTLAGLGALSAQLGRPAVDVEAIAATIKAETGLDLEDDILAWVGGGATYVSGLSDSPVATGMVLDTTDTDASIAAIEAAERVFEREAPGASKPPQLEGADAGFSFRSLLGPGLEFAQREDRVVAALGAHTAAEALEPEESLGDTELFADARAALGDDHAAMAFLDLEQALAVAEQTDTVTDPGYQAIRPYLSALSYVIFGTASEDERKLSRLVIGVEE